MFSKQFKPKNKMKTKNIELLIFIELLILNCYGNCYFFDKGEIVACFIHGIIVSICTFTFWFYNWKPENKNECKHKKGSVDEIFRSNNLPLMTGDTTEYYEGYCNDCKQKVYGRISKTETVSWTTNRNLAFDK